MKVTSQTKTKIANALSDKGWNMSDLASKIDRTRSWVSKLLSDKSSISELHDEMVDKLSDVLGVPLRPAQTETGAVSVTAMRLSSISESDPKLACMLEHLLSLVEGPDQPAPFVPVVHQKQLIKIGAELTRIVHRWEEATDPHYAKIGAESLTFLRKLFSKI